LEIHFTNELLWLSPLVHGANQFGCWHAISFQYGAMLSAYH
jgi:hypothetical protein